MRIEPTVLLTIAGMALITFAIRMSGFWLMGRVTLSKRIEKWLYYIPGSILVAIIAPDIFSGGIAAIVAALLTVLVAFRTHSLPLAIVTGVGTILIIRSI